MANNIEDSNFDKAPTVAVEEYDKVIRLFCGAYEEIFKLSQCYLKANLAQKADILVVGAGTGMEIVSFSPSNPNWSFYGVDPSENMLSIAKKKVEEEQVQNKVYFVQGYVSDLDKNIKFDGATCILVMHFLEDNGEKLNLLRQIYKTLKPGATLILVDGCGDPESASFKRIISSWKQYPAIHGVDKNTVEKAFSETILKKIKFVSEDRIVELLNQAGFADISRFCSGFLYYGWGAYKK